MLAQGGGTRVFSSWLPQTPPATKYRGTKSPLPQFWGYPILSLCRAGPTRAMGEPVVVASRARKSRQKAVLENIVTRCQYLVVSVLAWMLFAGTATITNAGDAAVVNGKTISTDDVEVATKKSGVFSRNLSPERLKEYRKHVLKLLIDEMLVNQHLDKLKISADEKQVSHHIAEIEKQLVSKGKTLEGFLKELGVNEAKMREDITNIYRWINFVRSQATDTVLRDYFAANKAAFDGTKVRVRHILVKTEPTISADERKAARRKADQLREQLLAGGSFVELAKKHSDCPSKDEGGDLNFFERKGTMTEPFAAAAFDLQKGQLSEVVETEFGFHIILVTDRQLGKEVKFEQVLGDVEATYADDLREAIIARMRKNADIQIR